MIQDCDVDGWAVVDAIPTPTLLLRPDLTICGANPALEEAVGRTADELVGRYLFDAFPDNPEDSGASGVANLHASLDRVLRTGARDTMPLQRYDIEVDGDEGPAFERRYWSPVNAPVLDAQGEVVLLIHRVVDVTDLVDQRRRAAEDRERRAELSDRLASTETELFARAVELQQANEALRAAHDREQQVALSLLESMLPLPVAVRGLEIATRYLPAADATRVGGDWYDVSEITRGLVGVAVGDVMGHGLPAAGMMGQLRSALAVAMHATSGPARALEVVHTYMLKLQDADLATAVDVVLDLAEETICYSCAGHPPPILLRDGEAVLLEDATAPPLGVPSDHERVEASTPFPEGSALVLYTDGLVERRSRDIDAGVEALRTAVVGAAHLDAEAMADRLLDELLDEGVHADDVALVVVRR